MTSYEKSLRFGSCIVLCSLILRLFSQGQLLEHTQTGPAVRSSLPLWEYALESPAAAPLPTLPPEEPEALVFTSEDTVSIYNTSGLSADPLALLREPFSFPETEGPRVLLYSTHATESYTKGMENYQESAAYRTLDPEYNVLSLGKALEDALETQGVPCLRDETLHDYPSYNAAYSHSRKSVREYLEESPSLALALDLHRDAAATGSGQLRPLAQVEGQTAAKLMLVVGTDARGLVHPDWQKNLALALKLQALLERLSPGITRPTCLWPQRFNQDMSPGCLLIEVGAAGNTREEALRAIPILAQAIALLLGQG